MNQEQFIRVLASFADRPTDIDAEKGVVVAQVRDELVEVRLSEKEGQLYCSESEATTGAYEWLTRRIARLDSLARRMTEHIEEDDRLIPVSADFTDFLSEDPQAKAKPITDAVIQTLKLLDRRPIGYTSVLYLTSDAGAGKTSVINAMARRQADEYLSRRSSWLLLPISLGGKPFMRLDDLIVGALSNRFRFPFLYFDSVIELIRLGAIVLALDGFEEMFVEDQKGEAVSSLGGLLGRLESSGRVLVAARTAFYRYKGIESIGALSRSLGGADIESAELALRKWSKLDFTALAEKAGARDADSLYAAFEERLSKEHPMLTRAVLARRLIEECVKETTTGPLVERLAAAEGEGYFEEFVNALVAREAGEKWLDRSGESAKPLLSVEEHHKLLAHVAEEMWRASTYGLSLDLLSVVVELVVGDVLGRPPEIVRQARERAVHHAMFVSVEGSNRVEFDHEDFRSFYLGRRVSTLVGDQKNAEELRSFLNVGRLPSIASRTAVSSFVHSQEAIRTLCEWLCSIAASDRRTSFFVENCGQLVFPLACAWKGVEALEVRGVYFGEANVGQRQIANVRFSDCTFSRLRIRSSVVSGLVLSSCEVHLLEVSREDDLTGMTLDAESLPKEVALVVSSEEDVESERSFFDPKDIKRVLAGQGLVIDAKAGVAVEEPKQEDKHLLLAVRALRQYRRSTAINENTFRLKLGSSEADFMSNVLPALIKSGVLQEEGYKGAGTQKRFRLGVPQDELERVRSRCGGSFVEYMKLAAEAAR